ncbi:putative uncharacterized protein [Corallococcus sp. CAG:1435]|nr:putative uncharacterized protein [Corallococcus sp. CAG:1435]
MKKVLVIALAVVMTLAVVAFAACATEQTVTGKCHYASKWGAYGCMVDVTVKGDVITSVKLYTDAEAAAADKNWNDAHRTTPSWTKPAEGQLGYAATEAAYATWIEDTFVGKTVAEVNAYVASATADGQSVTTEGINLEGATQSAARVIVAVKDALSKLAK